MADIVRQCKSAAVLGLGNIGGFVIDLLARTLGLQHLTVLDRERYETKNVKSQNITPDDVNSAKALVQAERACRINPALRVIALVEDVESVALGLLRATVLLACLDSRRARQRVNQVAWRLGVPWIDAGVRADGLLARVNVYRPAVGQPCLECAWDQSDYELIEQTYPCQTDAPVPPATNAPAALGALAAALQVLECQKIFAGEWERVALGKQVLVDAASHRHFVTSFRRNPACRFDHAVWQIDHLGQHAHELSFGDALALGGRVRAAAGATLRVEGLTFVHRLVCPRCGAARELPWHLIDRLGPERECTRCRRHMLAAGTDVRDWLGEADLSATTLTDPLDRFGLRDGDIFTVRAADGECHFQLSLGAVSDVATESFGACG